MKSRNQDIGMGNYQREKAYYSQKTIFKILSDEKWHRNMELKTKSKLSPRTLAKHLQRLMELKLIERKEDVESGEYPVPVFYKAVPELIEYIDASVIRDEFSENVVPMLEEEKDPLSILEIIHDASQLGFIKILEEIRENKKMTYNELLYLEEIYLWAFYRHCTMKLIEATSKIIDEIDIDKLLVSQAKRQKQISELLLKRYKKNDLA